MYLYAFMLIFLSSILPSKIRYGVFISGKLAVVRSVFCGVFLVFDRTLALSWGASFVRISRDPHYSKESSFLVDCWLVAELDHFRVGVFLPFRQLSFTLNPVMVAPVAMVLSFCASILLCSTFLLPGILCVFCTVPSSL